MAHPEIIINGEKLTDGQARAVVNAVDAWAREISESGLTDGAARFLWSGYLERLAEVNHLLNKD